MEKFCHVLKSLEQYNPEKVYTIRVRVSGWFGNKTYGQIHIIRTGPAISTRSVNLQGSSIRLFPNPVTDLLRIDSQSRITALKIYAVTGKLFFSGTCQEAYQFEQDVRYFPPGIYITEVKTIDGPFTVKWIKN